ncbi:hypothetical protein PHYC_00965 [Phycisphaerales bacterium]|nr:hypothetical protein PHYC_00965 [Phycisphaerales bacterium]
MKTVATLVAMLTATTLVGCAEHEAYHFVSTASMPQTVTLRNYQSGENIWSQEIPVGKQLNVAFLRRADIADSQGWDEMRWSISDIGRNHGGVSSTIKVPPPSERRFDLHDRSTPEARPQLATPAPEPALGAPTPATATKPKPAKKPPEGVVMPDPKQAAPK